MTEKRIGSWNEYRFVLPLVRVTDRNEVWIDIRDAVGLEEHLLIPDIDAEVERKVTRVHSRLRIWFHGTTRENARQIFKTGFLPNTYFARHLEDAVEFGGPYVFEVVLGYGLEHQWQLRVADAVGVDKIAGLQRVVTTTMFNNAELRERVFASNRGYEK